MSRKLLRLFAVATALCAWGCRADGPARQGATEVVDPTQESYAPPPLPRAHAVLKDAYGGAHALEVEVAATPHSRERGLMWRKHLADGEGMLFIFTQEKVQSFWMKNTLIPLDMLFIDARGRVVGILEGAEPKTLGPRTVGRPSLYVLEVPGGWTSRIGVRTGSVAQFEGLGMIQVVP